MIRPPIPPSFTTEYGPGHIDTDAGVYACDAAADLEAIDGPGASVAILHIHLANVERPAGELYTPATAPRSVGVELSLADLEALHERLTVELREARLAAAERRQAFEDRP